jgi:hypothetical protein
MPFRSFKCGETIAVFAQTRDEVLEFLARNEKEPKVCRLMFFDLPGRGLVDLMLELQGAAGITLSIGGSLYGWGNPQELTVNAAAARVADVFKRFQRQTEEPARAAAPPLPPPRRPSLAQAEFALA